MERPHDRAAQRELGERVVGYEGFREHTERRADVTAARGEKSLYFTAGLMEGTETILWFLAMAIWPSWFALMAWVFGGLCLVTAVARILLARRVFG